MRQTLIDNLTSTPPIYGPCDLPHTPPYASDPFKTLTNHPFIHGRVAKAV